MPVTDPAAFMQQRYPNPPATDAPMDPLDFMATRQKKPSLWENVKYMVTEAPGQGVKDVIAGVDELGHEAFRPEGMRGKVLAGAASKTLRGAMQAATPLMVPALVAAPIPTLAGLAVGMGAQAVAEPALKAVGVPEEYAALGSDVAALAAGGKAAHSVSPRPKPGPTLMDDFGVKRRFFDPKGKPVDYPDPAEFMRARMEDFGGIRETTIREGPVPIPGPEAPLPPLAPPPRPLTERPIAGETWQEAQTRRRTTQAAPPAPPSFVEETKPIPLEAVVAETQPPELPPVSADTRLAPPPPRKTFQETQQERRTTPAPPVERPIPLEQVVEATQPAPKDPYPDFVDWAEQQPVFGRKKAADQFGMKLDAVQGMAERAVAEGRLETRKTAPNGAPQWGRVKAKAVAKETLPEPETPIQAKDVELQAPEPVESVSGASTVVGERFSVPRAGTFEALGPDASGTKMKYRFTSVATGKTTETAMPLADWIKTKDRGEPITTAKPAAEPVTPVVDNTAKVEPPVQESQAFAVPEQRTGQRTGQPAEIAEPILRTDLTPPARNVKKVEGIAPEGQAATGANQPWKYTFEELLKRGDPDKAPDRNFLTNNWWDGLTGKEALDLHAVAKRSSVQRSSRDAAYLLEKSLKAVHRKAVESALAAGKSVPPEVLKDYPDLLPKPAPIEPPSKPVQAGRELAAPEPVEPEVLAVPAPIEVPKPPAAAEGGGQGPGGKAETVEPLLVAPIVPDSPRPLKKAYGPNWESRPDAAELKKKYNAAVSARSKALGQYRQYVEESNARLAVTGGPAPAKPKTEGFLSSESGALSIPFRPKPPAKPLTPVEAIIQRRMAERKAARQGPAKSLGQGIAALLREAKTKLVDSTSPILDAEAAAAKKFKFQWRPTETMERLVDKVYRSDSLAEAFLEDHGFTKMVRGVADDTQYHGLGELMTAKQAYHRVKDFADPKKPFADEYKRITGHELAEDQAIIADLDPKYQTQLAAFRKMDHALLDYLTDAGKISKDFATQLKDLYPDWVPMSRVFPEAEGPGFAGQKGVASTSKLQSIERYGKGSDAPIEDPFAAFIDKAFRAFKEGEQNKAARALASWSEMPGLSELVRPLYTGETAKADASFNAFIGGQKKTFVATREIAAAAKSLDRANLGLLGRIIMAPTRLAKTFITGINPGFLLSNVPADMGHTAVVSKFARTTFNPEVFMRAFWSAMKHDALYSEMVKEGAGFTSVDMWRNPSHLTIEKIRAGRSADARAQYALSHPIKTLGDIFRQVEDFTAKSEQLGRLRLYQGAKESLLKQGRTLADAKALAAVESNNVLPNYMRAGDWGRAMNGAILYLNANIQGARTLLRAAAENPKAAALLPARIAIALYTPVALATLWNVSDPERKKAYDDAQEWEKDTYLVFMAPRPVKDKNGRWSAIKIKISPGLNTLGRPVRRFIEAAHGMDPQTVAEVAQDLFGVVSPIGAKPNQMLSSGIPQALKPTVQAAANYDFFREGPKVPEGMRSRPLEAQRFPYTSETASKVAGAFGLSPIKTEEFIKDTLGGMGPQILNVSDRALAATGAIKPEQVSGEGIREAIASRFSEVRGGAQRSEAFGQGSDAGRKALDRSYRFITPRAAQEMVKVGVGYGAAERKDTETDQAYTRRMQRTAREINIAVLQSMRGVPYRRANKEKKAEILKVAIRRARAGA